MTVITIGEILVDWLSTQAGQTFKTANNFSRGIGGNATNVAIGLSRLGTCCRLVGKVGDDIHGQYLSEILQAEGVDLSCLKVDQVYPTAQCYALTDSFGNHDYYNWPRAQAAQMLTPDEIEEGMFDGFSHLHATGVSLAAEPRRSAVLRAMDLARLKNMVVSFDANFATDQGQEAVWAVEDAFTKSHILKFNHHELLYWRGCALKTGEHRLPVAVIPGKDELEAAARQLFQKYQPVVLAVTMSEAGSMLLLKEATVYSPAYSIDFVSGIGAGDAFMAGMIHALHKFSKGLPDASSIRELTVAQWKEIATVANAVGALATTTVCACDGLPNARQLEAMIEGLL